MSAACACPSHACPVEPREPRHVRCRPCAVGNHTGRRCPAYVRLPLAHLDRSCATCGFDSAAHPEARG